MSAEKIEVGDYVTHNVLSPENNGLKMEVMNIEGDKAEVNGKWLPLSELKFYSEGERPHFGS